VPPIKLMKRQLKLRERGGDFGFECKRQAPDAEPEAWRCPLAVVDPEGPADVAGMKVGDEIRTIEGHDVTGANRYLMGSLMAVPEGTAVAFGLADGRTVTIKAGPPE